MAKETADGLERDFGYLMPFFDKVSAAAAGVQNPAAREELGRLLSGEKAKWERIRALLAGAAGQDAAPEQSRTASNGDMRPTGPAKAVAAPEQARSGFTVGTLRRR